MYLDTNMRVASPEPERDVVQLSNLITLEPERDVVLHLVSEAEAWSLRSSFLEIGA
jgi:hypothetical protein